jgi:hypothetical protein
MTQQEAVFVLWCRLTGTDPTVFTDADREAFLARPQVAELAATPYPVLLDAGVSTSRRGSLPLEHWLAATRAHRMRAAAG